VDWIVAPDPDGRALRDVLPSMLAAMGIDRYTDTIGIPPCRNALVLLIDGLGHELPPWAWDDVLPALIAVTGR
jgi:hypothetical protein